MSRPGPRVLAVDGGQSAIRIAYSDGRAPVELEGVSHQEGDTISTLADATVDGWRALGAPVADRAVLGLTTAPAASADRERLCRRVGTMTHIDSIWLADDAVTAHAGALSLGWGVSVTAGTGVACVARAPDGVPVVIGGHGFLLGDEGGGFWIGREGIRAALRASDGRGEATALVSLAAVRFGGLEDLGARLHGQPRPVDAIARFAPDVLAAAGAGDGVATRIVDLAADELVVLVRAAVAAVGSTDARVPLALGGRLLERGLLLDRVVAGVERAVAGAEVRSADGPPLKGALLLGASSDPGAYAPLVHVWQAS